MHTHDEDDDSGPCFDCLLIGCPGDGEECPCNFACHEGDDEGDTQPMAVAAKVAVLRADGVRR